MLAKAGARNMPGPNPPPCLPPPGPPPGRPGPPGPPPPGGPPGPPRPGGPPNIPPPPSGSIAAHCSGVNVRCTFHTLVSWNSSAGFVGNLPASDRSAGDEVSLAGAGAAVAAAGTALAGG